MLLIPPARCLLRCRMTLRGCCCNFLGEEQPVIQLTPEEVASLAESRAQASRREFATDEQVRAVWAKHGL